MREAEKGRFSFGGIKKRVKKRAKKRVKKRVYDEGVKEVLKKL